jgi:hypothetical protein
MVLIDGERVSTKCTLEAATSADGLLADIEQIRFEVSSDFFRKSLQFRSRLIVFLLSKFIS